MSFLVCFSLEQLTVSLKPLSHWFIVFPPVWIGKILFYFNDYICLNILIRNSALLKLRSSLVVKQLCSQMLGCYKELNSNRKAGKKKKLQELLYAFGGNNLLRGRRLL